MNRIVHFYLQSVSNVCTMLSNVKSMKDSWTLLKAVVAESSTACEVNPHSMTWYKYNPGAKKHGIPYGDNRKLTIQVKIPC